MRRTIATILLLAWGAPSAAVLAADHSQAANGWQQVAKYHVGDADDEAAAPAAAVGTGAGGAQLSAASYYDAYAASAAAYATSTNAAAAATRSTAPGAGMSCSQGACNTCNNNNCGCGDCHVNAFRAEYLLWFTRGRNVPPLVSNGPLDGTGNVLYGDDPIGTDLRSGGRLTFNHLFADGATWGDLRFWGLEDSSETFFTSSSGDPGSPVIGRPFNNVLTGPDFLSVAESGVAANGSIRVLSKNDLIGGDAWFRQAWSDDGCTRIDLLAGYMFTRLDDSLTINSIATNNQIQDPSFGMIFNVTDTFRTENEFHGGQIGILATRRGCGPVGLEVLAKIALGDMRQAVTIDGSQIQTSVGGGVVVNPSGLLAQPTNIGTYERHRFAVVPELNVNLVYDVNPCWRLMAGYSFIYWSNVVLAGNQIDTTVDPSQLGTSTRPAFDFTRTDYWAQGLSLGAEYRW